MFNCYLILSNMILYNTIFYYCYTILWCILMLIFYFTANCTHYDEQDRRQHGGGPETVRPPAATSLQYRGLLADAGSQYN